MGCSIPFLFRQADIDSFAVLIFARHCTLALHSQRRNMTSLCHRPLAYCLLSVSPRSHRQDKGLEGQILSKASSKIDFRLTAARAQWTVNMLLRTRVCLCGVCVCGKSWSTCPFGHYLSDITKLAPVFF